MQKTLKKYSRYTSSYLKKTQKLVSVLVIFLLLSTLLSSVVRSDSINLNSTSKDSENTDESKSPLKKLLEGKSIKEHLARLKEKINNLRDRLSQLKNRLSGIYTDETVEELDDTEKSGGILTKTTFTKTLRSFLTLKNSGSSLMVHTNYNGNEKDTNIKLFGSVKIDVDDDPEQKEDISVELRLFPFIEKPLCLSIQFKLVITRLDDFPDYETANFSAYAEFYFLGILNAKQKGDRIRFGYESPEDEEVPDECIVTYKLLPHILSSQRPEHRAELNPGSSSGNPKLALLLSYTNFEEGSFVSELRSRVIYNPAVKSEITVTGDGILGGSTFNFKREISGGSQVDMYCAFEKGGTAIYGYVKGVPEKVTFNMDFGKNGLIEFDTYNNPTPEIGICDNFDNPKNYLYFANLPSKARLVWNRDLLISKKANISFYTEGPDISLNGHLDFIDVGIFDFSVFSAEHLNCSLELDALEGYLIIKRNEVDISFSLSAVLANSGTFDFSFDLERFYDPPFKITFGSLVNENIEFSLASKHFVINNFYMMVGINSSNIGIKADKLVKENNGNITVNLSYEKDGKNITFDLSIHLECNISIYNLSLCYNDVWSVPQDFKSLKEGYHHFVITLQFYDLEYYVAEDWSWGYFFFRFGIEYETYKNFSIDGTPCGFKGKIYIGSGSDGFNISWYTNTSKGYNVTKLNITGFEFGLEDFHFFLGKMIDISISEIAGSIELVEACNESGDILFELQGDQSSLDFNVFFNLTNNESGFEFTFNVEELHIDLADSSALFEATWKDGNISSFAFQADSNINLTIRNLDIILGLGGAVAIGLENMSGYLHGYAGFDLDLTLPLNLFISNKTKYLDFSEDNFAISLSDMDVKLHMDVLNLAMVANLMGLSIPDPTVGFDLGKVKLSVNVTGDAKISLLNISRENYYWNLFYWSNFTFGFDANNGDLNLRYLEIENFDNIILAFGFVIPYKLTLVIENFTVSGYSKFTLVTGAWGTGFVLPTFLGMRFENEIGTYVTMDRLSAIFPDLLENMNGELKANLTEDILENLSENPFQFFIEDMELVDGIFEIVARTAAYIALQVTDGSAIQHVDIGLELPNLLSGFISIDQDFDYFNFDMNANLYNETPPYDQYLLIDTYNSTIKFNIYILISAGFINLAFDYLNYINITNLTYPYIENDVGIHFDDATFKADEFYMYFNTSAVPQTNGYVQIESGEILLLNNGTWESISPEGFSITYYPGHLEVKFNIAFEDLLINFNHTFSNGDLLIFSGEFTVNAPNLILDIWWDWTDDNITFKKLSIIGLGYIDIKDFIFEIGKNLSLSFTSLLLNGQPQLINISIEYVGEQLALCGSIGVSLILSNFNLHWIAPNNMALLQNFTFKIPFLDFTFDVGDSMIMFAAIPLIIIPTEDDIPPLGIGDTVQLKALGAGFSPVTWFSRHPWIADVDQTGLVTAWSKGTATITAWTQDGRRATTKVTVTEDFFITPRGANLYIDGTLQLRPHNQVDPVTWESNNSAVASVNETGFVTAHMLGKATITATDFEGNTAESTISVIRIPPLSNETILTLEGRFLLSGKVIFGLFKVGDGENATVSLYWYLDGSLNVSNAYLNLVCPKGLSGEVIIPNKLEIKDGKIDFTKENHTSPAYLGFSGEIKIDPGKSDWGYFGIGFRIDDLTTQTNLLMITLESLYFNININSSETPEIPGSEDPALYEGEIVFIIDKESERIQMKSSNDTISLEFTHFNVSIFNFLNLSIESFKWNKLGKIDLVFDFGYGYLPDPQGGQELVYGTYIKLKYYSYHSTILSISNINIKVNLPQQGWINLPIISWLNGTKFNEGYQSIAMQWMAGIYWDISLDMNSTWNCSISVGPFWGVLLEGNWLINSKVASNWTMYWEPNYLEWTIHEPGFMRFFELTHKGALLGYYRLTIGPIELTSGTIQLAWDSTGLPGGSGWFYIDNQDIYGGGELLKIDLTRFCSITLGTFEINPGSLSFLWDLEDNGEENWVEIENDGMYLTVGLLKINKGLREINLLELSLAPGETYVKFKKNTDSGYLDIDNTASIELVLLEVMWGTDFFKIGGATKIQMNSGKFNMTWEDLNNDPNYDHQFVINNGIFEVERLDLIIKIDNLEVSFDKRDFNFSNYDNTITVKLRLRGNLNRAIYINTTDYIEMTRATITISSDGEELLKLQTFINLKFKFNEWSIGFIDGEFWHDGRIKPKLDFSNIIALFNLSWKNEYNESQGVNIHGFANSTKANIFIDAANCTEDLTHNWPSFKLGKYTIVKSFTLNAQGYLEGELEVNLPENPNPGDTGNLRIYIDNGGQSLLGESTFKILREDKGRGINITVEGLEANGFWISGECEYKWLLGRYRWIPKWNTIESGGDIDCIDIIIKISLRDNNWVTIWPLGGAPVASYTWSPQYPQAGQLIQFDASGSYDPDGEIIQYDWKWFSTDSWHNDLGPTPTHIYSSDGTYDVTLRIWSNFLISDTYNHQILLDSNGLIIDIIDDGEELFEGKSFNVSVTEVGNPVNNALITYYQLDTYGNSHEEQGYTNINGEVEFIAYEVPEHYYVHYSDAIIYVDLDGDGDIDAQSDLFYVYDTAADIHGYVRDLVTHYGIPDALVETNPGGYYVYSEDYPGEDAPQDGKFKLLIPQGTYDITASKSGYESTTIEDFEANQGGYHYAGDIFLPSLSYGGLRGTVYDISNGGTKLRSVAVTVEVPGDDIITSTNIFGVFPEDYPSPAHAYYSIMLSPGTYTVTFTKENYYTHSEQVTIVAGEVLDIDVNLELEWLLPNGYTDPSSDWNYESDAYDDDIATSAKSNIRGILQGWQWTGDLELEIPQLNCDEIKFYADYHPDYIDKIKISIYYSGNWHNIYEGAFNDKAWDTKTLGGTYSMTKAKVSFYLKGCLTGTFAEVFEFRFHKVN